jgi:uncharacterized protein with ATP-grasp and redox domains
MQTLPECYRCLLQQSLSYLDLAGIERDHQTPIIKQVLFNLSQADPQSSPPEVASLMYGLLRKATGVDDPYLEIKKNSHLKAFSYLEDLRRIVKENEGNLEFLLKMCAAGNIIDIVHARDYHLWEEVETTVQQELEGDTLHIFQDKLQEAPFLLILADNVGETVFDRVLIENISVPVIYAVKGGPIINDATRQDALAAGIDQVAEIIETGSRAPGTVLAECSDEFQELFQQAELVLAKGQANFETLNTADKNCFFLLRVKCPVLGEYLNKPVGSLLLIQNRSDNE